MLLSVPSTTFLMDDQRGLGIDSNNVHCELYNIIGHVHKSGPYLIENNEIQEKNTFV